jgi:hypothetical protein
MVTSCGTNNSLYCQNVEIHVHQHNANLSYNKVFKKLIFGKIGR